MSEQPKDKEQLKKEAREVIMNEAGSNDYDRKSGNNTLHKLHAWGIVEQYINKAHLSGRD